MMKDGICNTHAKSINSTPNVSDAACANGLSFLRSDSCCGVTCCQRSLCQRPLDEMFLPRVVLLRAAHVYNCCRDLFLEAMLCGLVMIQVTLRHVQVWMKELHGNPSYKRQVGTGDTPKMAVNASRPTCQIRALRTAFADDLLP